MSKRDAACWFVAGLNASGAAYSSMFGAWFLVALNLLFCALNVVAAWPVTQSEKA
jgi:uncharacterized protein (DUF58 family)